MDTIVAKLSAKRMIQKKGRPFGRPCIALDCCAPDVHPYTVETSLQLALPVPGKCEGTSLLASLLKLNICHHLTSVKQILNYCREIVDYHFFYINIIQLCNISFFNILNIYTIFCAIPVLPKLFTKENIRD